MTSLDAGLYRAAKKYYSQASDTHVAWAHGLSRNTQMKNQAHVLFSLLKIFSREKLCSNASYLPQRVELR